MTKIRATLVLLLLPLACFSQDTLKLSMLFTGDIMQHESQIYAAFDPVTGRYDYRPCFQFIKSVLTEPDLTIGNLELTLAGPPYKGYPQFSAPDELLDALKDAGYDALVTANNHCVDRGASGLERTIDMLDSVGMPHTGTFKDTLTWLNEYPLVVEAKNFRFSLLNYTYGTNGLPVTSPNIVNRIDTASIRRDIMKAKGQRTDAIIVFFHWGQEYQSLPNKWQKDLADFCFKLGATFVIGAHPHVLQPMEWRKEAGRVVAYSLGNFVSGQRERYRNGGALLHVAVRKILRPDGTSSFEIADVSYSLDAVYRAPNARKTYHILPVEQFENDTTFVEGKVRHDMIIQFRDDSRLLFGKYNVNVSERMPTLKDH
ncbi:MAG TPA: CapA family protein [Cyclobacteriaceae bacterium]|nr:CapA family protein [Cyclobacteriaceae bacterium]